MATVTIELDQPALAMATPPGGDDILYDGSVFRRLLHSVFQGAGVVSGATHLKVVERAAGANWSIDIGAGSATVPADNGVEKYYAYTPAVVNVDLAGLNTAPVATRTHKVWLAVYDANVVGTASTAAFVVTEDTGAGAPTPPGDPVGYIQLGQFTISPAQGSVQTSHITDTRPLVGTTGGRMVTLGRANVDFDTSGIAAIAHSGAFVPQIALVSADLTSSPVWIAPYDAASWTASSFKVRCWDSAGDPYTGVLSRVNYLLAS